MISKQAVTVVSVCLYV